MVEIDLHVSIAIESHGAVRLTPQKLRSYFMEGP